jgi:hypothetical protein
LEISTQTYGNELKADGETVSFCSNAPASPINTDGDTANTAWVTVDAMLHKPGDTLTCIYSSDPAQIGSTVTIQARDGLSVLLSVSAAGLIIFK